MPVIKSTAVAAAVLMAGSAQAVRKGLVGYAHVYLRPLFFCPSWIEQDTFCQDAHIWSFAEPHLLPKTLL